MGDRRTAAPFTKIMRSPLARLHPGSSHLDTGVHAPARETSRRSFFLYHIINTNTIEVTSPKTAAMAILSALKGLQVQIVVDGSALKEYHEESDAGPNSVVSYVEAVSGAKFEVHITFERGFTSQYDIRSPIYVDGCKVNTPVFHKYQVARGHVRCCKGATSRVQGITKEAHFRFSDLAMRKFHNCNWKYQLSLTGSRSHRNNCHEC